MSDLIAQCRQLLDAYQRGMLGYMKMPEDEHPVFANQEERLCYFTLPMALNYQRNSYKLWEAAKQTHEASTTKDVFVIKHAATMPCDVLREKLTRFKVALQPTRHPDIRQRIAMTVNEQRGSMTGLLEAASYDFLCLQELLQQTHKKGFPYLSGPKIFHYWCRILGSYAGVELSHREHLGIAPDTHVIQASVKLGVLTEQEAKMLSRDAISLRRKELLAGSGIVPIDMHSPLWFWSRNKFSFVLEK